jgi:cation transport regulator
MPYKSKSDLPENVRNVLQEIFVEAYYSASDQYDEPEARRGDSSR